MGILAQITPDPASMFGGLITQFGLTGVAIIGLMYLFRYFVSKLDQKDIRNDAMADRFATSLEKQAQSTVENAHALITMATAIKELTVAVHHLDERRSVPRSGP